MYKTKEISLNLITPIEALTVKDGKTTKNVIGFNDNNVFTFTEAKKNPGGNAELRKDVEYDDYCIDFTLKVSGLTLLEDT